MGWVYTDKMGCTEIKDSKVSQQKISKKKTQNLRERERIKVSQRKQQNAPVLDIDQNKLFQRRKLRQETLESGG